jgi:hypothetical protein
VRSCDKEQGRTSHARKIRALFLLCEKSKSFENSTLPFSEVICSDAAQKIKL